MNAENQAMTPNAWAEHFRANGIALSHELKISEVNTGAHWRVTSGDDTYAIKREGAALNVYSVPRPKVSGMTMLKQVGLELALAGLFATITFFRGCFLLRVSELGMILDLARDTLKYRREMKSGDAPEADDSDEQADDTNADDKASSP